MKECICSSCGHLHDILGDNGPTGETECRYGYPGEACESCELGECDLSCPHWLDAELGPGVTVVRCADCGKEIEADVDDGEDGSVYCVTCYLKRESN